MKIIYVSPYPPAPDGIGTYTQLLAEAVLEAHHDVGVVTPRVVRDGSPAVIGTLALTGARYAALRQALTDRSPDIVHIQFAIAAFGTRLPALMRLLGALREHRDRSVVVTMHEFTRDSAMLGPVARALYRWVAARCDHVIVHTEMASRAVQSQLRTPSAKITVIPHHNGHRDLPAARSSEELRARTNLVGARVVLAFGFIHVDKGLDDLIVAFQIIRNSGACPADLRLVIAGAVRPRHGVFRMFELRDRRYLARLQRLVRRGGLEQVVFTGYVPDSDVAPWFRLAEAVVLPYRRTEQSGVAALARSFGTPVLMSAVGGLAEQLGAVRWTFPPRSPDRLAAVLAEFLSADSTEGRAGGQAALPEAPGSADVQWVAAQTTKVYGEVVADRSRILTYAA